MDLKEKKGVGVAKWPRHGSGNGSGSGANGSFNNPRRGKPTQKEPDIKWENNSLVMVQY